MKYKIYYDTTNGEILSSGAPPDPIPANMNFIEKNIGDLSEALVDRYIKVADGELTWKTLEQIQTIESNKKKAVNRPRLSRVQLKALAGPFLKETLSQTQARIDALSPADQKLEIARIEQLLRHIIRTIHTKMEDELP